MSLVSTSAATARANLALLSLLSSRTCKVRPTPCIDHPPLVTSSVSAGRPVYAARDSPQLTHGAAGDGERETPANNGVPADSYGNLSLTLHSAAVSQLEAAQEEVTREVVGGIKEQQQRVARRAAAHDQLAASVLSARASKTATSPGGRSQSTEIVDMAVAATVFDDELCAATTEFARLRAEWEDACAEIEAVGRELQAYQGLDADVELGKGSTAQQPSREIEEMESEHGAAVAEFREELETLSVDAVAEYKSYEKVSIWPVHGCSMDAPRMSRHSADPQVGIPQED